MSTEPPKGDIPAPHGIRFLKTILLTMAHKGMELDFNPISNRNEMIYVKKNPFSSILRVSSLHTDSFIMLSGMLVAYSLVGRLQRGQNIKVLKEIAARYFRILPPMAALIIFTTFILPILSNGPQWNMLITNQSQLCKFTWWKSIFMIHNWFGIENMCMMHTHHVGVDFELFLCAPFIIMFLYKHPRKASATLFLLALASTIARFYVTYKRRMSVYVLFGLELVYFTFFKSLFFFHGPWMVLKEEINGFFFCRFSLGFMFSRLKFVRFQHNKTL
jgi:peptidoglycan/LPS O-acetylase OafA/YrhL